MVDVLDELTVNDLKSAIRNSEEALAAVLREFEDIYDLRIADIVIDRDDNNNVGTTKVTLFEPTMNVEE